MLNIIAVYSLSLSIIIFKIITKNSKISLKLPIQGQQPNNRLSDSSDNFRADRSWPDKQFYACQICSKCFGFWVISQIYISPLCSIFSHGGHLGWLARSRHTFFKLNTPKMIVAKFGLIWPSSFRGEDFCKRLLRFTKNG